MKPNIKRVLFLLAVVIVVMFLHTLFVFAAETDTHVTITGTGWTYDSSTKTLTLNDFKSTTKETVDGIESQIYADGDLNVVLEGTNELKTSSDYGLYCDREADS